MLFHAVELMASHT